jgi:hypothetical protein
MRVDFTGTVEKLRQNVMGLYYELGSKVYEWYTRRNALTGFLKGSAAITVG